MSKSPLPKKHLLIIVAMACFLMIAAGAGYWLYFSPLNIDTNLNGVATPVSAATPALTSTPIPTSATISSSDAIDASATAGGVQQSSSQENKEVLPPIPAEMAKEIRTLANRSTDGLVQKTNADGSVGVDLQGRFQSVTAAAIGPDGKIIIRHGEDFLQNVEAK